MKNTKRIMKLTVLAGVTLLLLTGCSMLDSWGKDIKEAWQGLPVTVQTYDENSQIIDRVKGKSLSITRDKRFDLTNSDGDVTSASKVLNITVGGKEVIHVGSSLIAAEDGLVDEFDNFAKTNDITNMDRSVPFMNRMANGFKNKWKPTSKVVLIRSQNGTPLATYVGDEVMVESTDVPSSTSLLIDGKRLFIYRSDYTIYEMALFE